MNRNSMKTDILIIGGGIIGCSCAYYLAKAGKKVILVERRNIASGASGRNGGQVMQTFGREVDPKGIINRLTYTSEGNRMLKGLSKELNMDLEYEMCGSLDLSHTKEEAEELEELVNIHHQAGDTEIEWLTKDETKEFCPSLAQNIQGARFRRTDGIINPFLLNYGFAEGAKRYGAQIFTCTEAEEILIENKQVKGVKTSRGLFRAPIVINATNAWASFLTKEINIFPLRMVAVVSEKVPKIKGPGPMEAEINGEALFTTTQTHSGNILVGGLGTEARDRSGQYDLGVHLAEIQRCTSIIPRFLPSLAHINIIRAWAGTMAVSRDGLPCIGPVPNAEGLILAAGFSDAMSLACIVGRLVAEYITHSCTSLPLDIFDPGRFYKKKISWPEIYNYTEMEKFLGRI